MFNTIQNVHNGIIIGIDDEIPNRKKPCLISIEGCHATVYGTFQNEERANEFFDILTKFLEKVGGEYAGKK